MAIGVQVVIDCADPARLADFWAAALGYTLQDPPPGFASWQAVLEAQHVPESEWNAASANAEAARLESLGATRLWTNDHGRGYSIVMADPEGNEFCVH